MVFIWKLCGVHIELCDFHVDKTWLQHGHYVVSRCTPHSSHVDTMWFPCGHHLVFRLKPCGVNVETAWETPISKILIQLDSSHQYNRFEVQHAYVMIKSKEVMSNLIFLSFTSCSHYNFL